MVQLSLPPALSGNFITILTAADNIGKAFYIKEDGTIGKINDNVNDCWGTTVPCRCLTELACIIAGLNYRQAIMTSYIPATIGKGDYLMKSMGVMRGLIGMSVRERPVGVYTSATGHLMCARIAENFTYSKFCLLDRDHDRQMGSVADATYDLWWNMVTTRVPAFAGAQRLIVPSSKRRVMYANSGVLTFEGDNSHTYVELADVADAIRFYDSLKNFVLGEPELSYDQISTVHYENKPDGTRCARKGVIDVGIWQTNRVNYEGQPGVGAGLALTPADITVLRGSTVDTSLMATYDSKHRDACIRAARGDTSTGVASVHEGRRGSAQEDELTWDMLVDTDIYGWQPIYKIFNEGWITNDGPNLRCQTVFRVSDSLNGFMKLGGDGMPILHDNGLAITYNLTPDEIARYWFGEGLDDDELDVARVLRRQQLQAADPMGSAAPDIGTVP